MRMVFMMIGALAWSAAAAAAPPPEADRIALERLAAENDSAWNRKDVAAILNQYAADGTLRVSPAAKMEKGEEEIRTFFQASFARRGDGFRHVTELRNIEMIAPGIAMADAHVRVEKANGSGWALVREFSNNSLVVREGESWKLHSVRAYPLPAEQSR